MSGTHSSMVLRRVSLIVRKHIEQSNLIENVKDPKEIEQSLLAWSYISEQDNLTLEIVLRTHELIMANLLSPKDAGHLRKFGVTVGNRLCPAPRYVPELVDEWLEDMQNWKDHEPKKMHVWFERIHPFIDGNGRSGRMYMWWHEHKLEQKLTLINYLDRWSYYDWF
jgi:Fic family protein